MPPHAQQQRMRLPWTSTVDAKCSIVHPYEVEGARRRECGEKSASIAAEQHRHHAVQRNGCCMADGKHMAPPSA